MTARQNGGQGFGPEWIVDTIKRNPEGLLLLAAGAVLMLRTNTASQGYRQGSQQDDRHNYYSGGYSSGFENARDAATGTASQMFEKARDRTQDMMEAAQSAADGAIDTAKSYASSVASSAADYGTQARATLEEQSGRMRRQAQSTMDTVLDKQPLAVMAVGLLAGAAIAAAFPPTEIEKQTLGPISEEMSRAAGRFGDQLRQATVKAGEKLKSEVEERGLHPDGLKDVAGEVVETFKSSMSGETGGQKAAETGATGSGQ